MKQVLYIVGTVALVALVAGGVYFYKEQQIDELATERDSLARNLESARTGDAAPSSDAIDQKAITSYISEGGVAVTVTTPRQRSTVASPLEVNGSVPGSWSHEAQFTVRLIGTDGAVIAEGPASLQGEWMTEESVPFTATLTFETTDSGAGILQLVKANPSGLEENNDSVHIPVVF